VLYGTFFLRFSFLEEEIEESHDFFEPSKTYAKGPYSDTEVSYIPPGMNGAP
jgi:hypothetical protein